MIDPMPEQLPLLASKAKKEHMELLKRLKRLPDAKVDELFRNAHSNIDWDNDCLSCANCCKSISPIVIDRDIDRIAARLRMKPSELVDKYLVLDSDGDYVFRTQPCPFLLPHNYCTIYEDRPRACREYPHTDRKRIKGIFNLTLKNALVCPAVYNVLKEIKGEVG